MEEYLRVCLCLSPCVGASISTCAYSVSMTKYVSLLISDFFFNVTVAESHS